MRGKKSQLGLKGWEEVWQLEVGWRSTSERKVDEVKAVEEERRKGWSKRQ